MSESKQDTTPIDHMQGGIALPSFYQAREGEDLPMVLWLRGDEELMDEFTVDADGAMAFLGIKRTRLTQISGRELRVARVRIDRYIRPMYRQEDLTAYKAWTRSPATHQSAAEAIRDAAGAFEDVAETLLARWQASQPPTTVATTTASATPLAASLDTQDWGQAWLDRLRAVENRLRHQQQQGQQWLEQQLIALQQAWQDSSALAKQHETALQHMQLLTETLFSDQQSLLTKTSAMAIAVQRCGDELQAVQRQQGQLAQLMLHTWQNWRQDMDQLQANLAELNEQRQQQQEEEQQRQEAALTKEASKRPSKRSPRPSTWAKRRLRSFGD